MSFDLSEQEIRQRLIEWRNLKQLHAAQKKRNRQLEQRIKALEQENQLLKANLVQRDQLIEKLMLRIGDLEKMVFGSQHNRDNDSASGHSSTSTATDKEPKQRLKSSYQRPTPRDEDITVTKYHPITACKHCGGELSRFEEVSRYVEDIILPQLMKQATKTITKHVIERGYCAKCGNWTAALPLRGQLVSLGRNVKLLVTYLVTILDCSYEQVKTLTSDLYGLTLSDGEIVNILQETAHEWLPEYERIKVLIRAGPGVHLDETTWPIQLFAKHCFAWVMSAVNSTDRIYQLATSRGKPHATGLLSDAFQGVRITDCYAAYKHLPGLHQICWAHLYRKIRDLLENKNLSPEKQPPVQAWHDEFKAVYADLRTALAESFSARKRQRQEQQLRQRIKQLRQPSATDPKPLADLKNLLTEYDHALFTCLQFEGISCDNNRAERDLRSLVIKRKKSFGSRTEAGAHAMGILLSVAWSTWHANRKNFLPALAAITQHQQKA